MSKYLLPILAIAGALFGLLIVFWSQKTVPSPPVLFPPASSPYPAAIAGAGIIEASSQNISIGTPFNEIITRIYVIEGDRVKKGDLLFELDLRSLEAQLATASANLQLAQTTAEDKKKQFSFYQRLKDTRSVSEEAYQQAYFALLEAEAEIKVSQAALNEVETNIQRSQVRAPVDGEILQVNIHVGEIAPIIPFISAQSTWLTAANGTLILMGVTDPLQVRIDIDEDDAWRLEKGSPAHAYVRGNRNINFPITFLRIEPYIIPKSSFTGQTTERVDTRVLQVLYQFERNNLPVYAGQIIDVFIKSKPISELVSQNQNHQENNESK